MAQKQAQAQNKVRQHILDTGAAIIMGKGFAAVGLNEILGSAGVPKGSFYHYFASKEQFGAALLDDYLANYLLQMDAILAAPGADAAAALMAYWASWTVQSDQGYDCRCLVVKLSSEVADMSEAMRQSLRDGTDRIVVRIALALEQAVAQGRIAVQDDPAACALTLYQLWLGAAMLTKLRRDATALEGAWLATHHLLGLPMQGSGPGQPACPAPAPGSLQP